MQHVTKRIVIAALCGAIVWQVPLAGYAAYPVFDSKNIAEAIKILNEAKKQYESLQEQIGIANAQLEAQKKALTDLPKGVLNDFKKMTNEAQQVINTTVEQNRGLLKPVTGKNIKAAVEEQIDATFVLAHTVGISPEKLNYRTAESMNAKTAGNVQKANMDTLTTVAAVEQSLLKDMESLDELQKMNAKVEGVKDAQQLANLIAITTSKIEAKTAQLNALRAKQQTIVDQSERAQAQNREIAKMNAAVENDKHYNPNPWENWKYEKSPEEMGKAAVAELMKKRKR